MEKALNHLDNVQNKKTEISVNERSEHDLLCELLLKM